MRFMLVLPLVLMGCTTAEPIQRADGRAEYIIACGAAVNWRVCDERAKEMCPAGYETLDKDASFNRKEMRVICSG